MEIVVNYSTKILRLKTNIWITIEQSRTLRRISDSLFVRSLIRTYHHTESETKILSQLFFLFSHTPTKVILNKYRSSNQTASASTNLTTYLTPICYNIAYGMRAKTFIIVFRRGNGAQT